MTKKKVIAYLHTHWDREWYREFEVFRLRLIKVMDNVLELLQNDVIPSFYFDGQIVALIDYLKFRKEKEPLIRELIKEKKLFIGPFYCLVDEFLTDGVCFRKNLEIGIKIAKEFGCEDFIGYFADTFGHSQNSPEILKEFGIDKAMVWRGVPDELNAEFIWNGVNTVNLVRGYFNDIFSTNKTTKEKADFLKYNLDLISEKSSDTVLLAIGGDHLNVPRDINKQISAVNELLDDYEIQLGSPFDYFNEVKFKQKYKGELRDNTKTFILPGSYSARNKLKKLNTECSYKLELADKLQAKYGNNYSRIIEYAYKLLLKNQAHDGICGCSTDKVHSENVTRYNKVLEIAQTVIDEIKNDNLSNFVISLEPKFKSDILKYESEIPDSDAQIIGVREGFPQKLLYNTNTVPVTEDYTEIYTQIKDFSEKTAPSDLIVNDNELGNSKIKLKIEDGIINLYVKSKCYENFIEFVRVNDLGDTYNFAPDVNSSGDIAKIISTGVLYNGELESAIRIKTTFFNIDVSLTKQSSLLNFKIKWNNLLTNKLWQVKFNFDKPVTNTVSEDMNTLIKRTFDPDYNIKNNLPNSKGIEVKTNFAPMQRFVYTQNFGIITKGLTEYEVFQNSLSVALLRSIGIISNPHNPARTTPAGPPIKVPDAQQLGENIAEFSLGCFQIKDWERKLYEVYPQDIVM